MSISRRGFLKSFGALAAAAVVSPTMLMKLAPTDMQRLLAAMKTGLIENQTFLFDGPITINFNNLIIRRCMFLFNCADKMDAAITIDANRLLMEYCHIDCGPGGAEFGIEVLPQRGAALLNTGVDMTSTLKSAIDTLSNGTDTEKALAFGMGVYAVNSPLALPSRFKKQ